MRIVIAEDHLMMREVIRRACVVDSGHHVVGEAELGSDAIRSAIEQAPDLVILDLGLPDMDGFMVASAILASRPRTRFLILTASLDEYTIYHTEKLGIHGFVDKNANGAGHLCAAMAALEAGRCYFSPAFQAVRCALKGNPRSFDKLLSVSEQKILTLIGEGLSDSEIGGRLGISPATSQTHRRNILQKLNIAGTPKLVAFARSSGFTRNPLPRSTTS